MEPDSPPTTGHGGGARPLTDVEFDDALVWSLVEAAPDGIVITDDAGKILLVNQRTEDLFGYDRGDLLGKPVEVLLPERARSIHRAHRTRYRAEPRVRAMGSGLDLRARRSDGGEFPVEISLSPLDAGTGTLVIATVRDISDRVAAEEENRRIRHILDATQDAVFIFDPTTLRFSYVNQGAAEQVGYRHDELLAMTPLHLNPELDEAGFRELLAPLLDGSVTARTVQTVHRHRSGRDVPVEMVMQYPPAREGTQRLMVALVRDIGERLETERRLRQNEERMLALYRVASDPGVAADEQFAEMLRVAGTLLDADGALLARPCGGDHVLEHGWTRRPEAPDATAVLGSAAALLAVDLGGLVAEHDLGSSAHPSGEAARQLGVASWLSVPVEVAGQSWASLAFWSLTPREPWREGDVQFVRLLANWMGRTEERNRTLHELGLARQELAVTEDRERIARDLHDTVIQRLFAAGMTLQGTLGRLDDGPARERIERAVAELDETIREIRSAIFGLQAPADGGPGLRGELARVVHEARPALGFSPRLQFDGPVESIAAPVAEQLLPSLREALANIARHASATAVRIVLSVGDEVVLSVTDNGVGVPDEVIGGHGLRNLADRAALLGGSCSVARADGGGTVVVWRVPAA